VNTGAPWPDLDEAESRVLVMQTKLHQWAKADPGRRFDDLANLVYDPAFLVTAWARVRGNKGVRTAGVDGIAPRSVVFGAVGLLGQLRDDLKAGRFVPQRVREKTIPKASGKVEHPAARPFKRALVEDGIPFTSFAVEDVAAEYERLVGRGVRFTQPPTDMGPVTTAVLDDTCGKLIQIAAEND
jgi:Glyoxalase/Bleomycin resistance protein/Dioxygenase superfamily